MVTKREQPHNAIDGITPAGIYSGSLANPWLELLHGAGVAEPIKSGCAGKCGPGRTFGPPADGTGIGPQTEREGIRPLVIEPCRSLIGHFLMVNIIRPIAQDNEADTYKGMPAALPPNRIDELLAHNCLPARI
jgi:hypothetical protein